jgi:hypothetical protein
MGNESKTNDNDSEVVSFRVTKSEKLQLKEEAALRGQGPSEAAATMFRFGRPRYLKRVPKKFERVESVESSRLIKVAARSPKGRVEGNKVGGKLVQI